MGVPPGRKRTEEIKAMTTAGAQGLLCCCRLGAESQRISLVMHWLRASVCVHLPAGPVLSVLAAFLPARLHLRQPEQVKLQRRTENKDEILKAAEVQRNHRSGSSVVSLSGS